jgi:hypothetical protein
MEADAAARAATVASATAAAGAIAGDLAAHAAWARGAVSELAARGAAASDGLLVVTTRVSALEARADSDRAAAEAAWADGRARAAAAAAGTRGAVALHDRSLALARCPNHTVAVAVPVA